MVLVSLLTFGLMPYLIQVYGMISPYLVTALILIVGAGVIVALRILFVALTIGEPLSGLKRARTLVVLGSGGHTSEMIRLLKGLDLSRYQPRTYLIASSDKMSLDKAKSFEMALPPGSEGSDKVRTLIAEPEEQSL